LGCTLRDWGKSKRKGGKRRPQEGLGRKGEEGAPLVDQGSSKNGNRKKNGSKQEGRVRRNHF